MPNDIDALIERNNTTTPIVPLLSPTKPTKVSLKDLQNRRLTNTTKYPAPTPVIRISGTNYANAGMISALTGPPKSGKTTVIGFMIATAFSHFNDRAQSLDIETTFANGRDVVYLDFEQHISSTQDLQDKVLKYAGLSQTPENLFIYNLLEMSLDERRETIDLVFKEHKMHLLIIDGLADILTSVNDEEKSNALIEELSLLASRHNTAVVVVIHENKGGGSVRGHLGSQIERKCAGLISIKKDREKKIHSIESRLIRIGDDFETVYFHFSEEQKRMVLLDAVATAELNEEAKQSAAAKKEEKTKGLMHLCFGNLTELPIKELRAKVCHFSPGTNSDKNADYHIKQAVDAGIITVTGERQHRLYTYVKAQA
ncbi:AAA family ATPase [Spirosoma aerolatum]|uniref:AAA family ATPase n=1 Tax=Spirosoma aerolatum TaxID=1211326 RepID=UPI0014748618|nr:AAA family ATPase [Spirosoma aerolatum]